MFRLLKKILNDDRGAAAVEYGLLCSLIILAILSDIGGVADETSSMWSEINSKTAKAINN